jgi:chromosome segregation ATPase
MDNINRRVSLKLMIEQAKNTHEKQHILITPQDLPNIAPDNCVKIQRLSDPERGQGVLAAH